MTSLLAGQWEWWIQPFVDNPFMRNALWASLLTVVLTSVVGTWVVLRGLAFLGDALAHGVLPGIAIAFIIGANTGVGAFIAAIVMVLGISFIRSQSPLPEDTSIGILFVGFLALAVVIMSSQRGAYFGDLSRFLFGSVSAATPSSIGRQLIAAVVVVATSVLFFRAFLAMTFDEIGARMLRLHPRIANLGLLVLLAIAIVASFETVGSLLVMAFLIAPPAAASLLARRVPTMMLLAIGLGSLAAVVGIIISYHHRTATGATMALATVVLFFGVLVGRSLSQTLRGRLQRRTA